MLDDSRRTTETKMKQAAYSRAARDAAARARLLAEALDHLAHCLDQLELPEHVNVQPMRQCQHELEPLWTIEDVATYLKASKSWVYHAAQSGRLPSIRVIRNLRFSPEAIKAFALGQSKR
ncbi:MAG: helix-turn-helix domain-containing protein [Myxococcales bacterium]